MSRPLKGRPLPAFRAYPQGASARMPDISKRPRSPLAYPSTNRTVLLKHSTIWSPWSIWNSQLPRKSIHYQPF